MKKLIIVIFILSSIRCLAQSEMKSLDLQNGALTFRNNIELNAGIEPRRHLFLGSIGYNFSLLDNYGLYITPSIGSNFFAYIDVSLKYKFPITNNFYITPQVSPGIFWGLVGFPPMVSLAASMEWKLAENVNLSFTPRIYFLAPSNGISAGTAGHELDLDVYPPIALTMGISF